MERRVRYEVVPSDDQREVSDAEETVDSPPEYVELESAPENGQAAVAIPINDTQPLLENEIEGEASNPMGPPSYTVATSLPSYEEAERSKREEEERLALERECNPEDGLGNGSSDIELGTDGMFISMFLLALIFNWLGLLASICLTRTIAGRFGAISGFGLSMVKWVLIARHNNWANGVAEGDSFVWLLLGLLGFLIFFRGCTQYIRIKYQWQKLGGPLRNRLYMAF